MKRVLRVLRGTVTVFMTLFTVAVMLFTILSMTGFDKDKSFLGYRFYIVLSDSMKGVFDVGDVVVSRTVDASALNEGDVITFKSADPDNYGAVVTHKIRSKTVYEGAPAFITYGVATDATDVVPVPEGNILGKYTLRIPKAGYVFDFLKSPAGYLVLILLPFSLLLLFEGAHFFSLLKRYKGEQQLTIDEQQRELLEEKKKTEEMIKELSRMREALEGVQTEQGNTLLPGEETEVDEKADESDNCVVNLSQK